MKGLLGPPPALLRLQSKAPSGAPAPTAELGTLCLRLHVRTRAPPAVLLEMGGHGLHAAGKEVASVPEQRLPGTCQCPANSPPEGDLGKPFYLEAGGQGFCP